MNPRERRYSAYAGIMIALLITLLLVTGCTVYRLKAPQPDGTVVSVFVMYPPGKKVKLSSLEYGDFKLGGAEGEQPGPSEYAAGVAAGIAAVYGLGPAPKASDDDN